MKIGVVKANVSAALASNLPGTLTVEEWTQTIVDFAGLCAYCQEHPVAVLEHFVPMRRGGGTTAGNCLPACQSCNVTKRDLLPHEFEHKFEPGRVAALVSYLATRSTGQDTGAIKFRPPPVPGTELVQFNFRCDQTLVDRLAKLSKDMNAELGWEKYTRSDLARDILLEGVEAREKRRPKR